MNVVKDIDLGWAKLKNMLAKTHHGPHVKVGVLGPSALAAHASSKMTTVEIASIHEFGRGRVPKRSFIRQTFDANRGKYAEAMRNGAARIAMGQATPKMILEAIGQLAQSDIQRAIEDGIAPPLQPATIARRNPQSSTPLLYTGQLKGSISYVTEGAL